ncbi:MAG: hypothetical protein WD875_12625, partial [Pirellulales bacterium]
MFAFSLPTQGVDAIGALRPSPSYRSMHRHIAIVAHCLVAALALSASIRSAMGRQPGNGEDLHPYCIDGNCGFADQVNLKGTGVNGTSRSVKYFDAT